VGVPYTDEMVENAEADLMAQADPTVRMRPGREERYPKAKLGDFDGNAANAPTADARHGFLATKHGRLSAADACLHGTLRRGLLVLRNSFEGGLRHVRKTR
jgi:hypothetical protein